MRPERSQQSALGILYLVAVPIGHLDDITLRAIRILRNVDLIASENPSATRRLLSHHGIDTALTSYGPTNLEEKAAVLIDRLERGARIALVSDCGSPVIADPGSILVTSARMRGIRVTSAPGPSALTAAISAAGLSTEPILFLGQLPDTPSEIRRRLAGHLPGTTSVVAFCTIDSLSLALDMVAKMAPQRRITLACDLTTPDERIVHGTVSQVRRMSAQYRFSRDITIILTGRKRGGAKTLRYKNGSLDQSPASRRINTR